MLGVVVQLVLFVLQRRYLPLFNARVVLGEQAKHLVVLSLGLWLHIQQALNRNAKAIDGGHVSTVLDGFPLLVQGRGTLHNLATLLAE